MVITSVNKDIFTSFSPVHMPLISFSYCTVFIEVVRACFWSRGKVFIIHWIRCQLQVCVLKIFNLYQVEEFLSFLGCLVFIMNVCWIFFKWFCFVGVFLAPVEMIMIFLLYFCKYGEWHIDLWILNQHCISAINPICSWCIIHFFIFQGLIFCYRLLCQYS